MAYIKCDFRSDILGMGMSMSIILPQDTYNRREKQPVLYLLHGLSDDHTIWNRMTSIERYANKYGLAVVMPNAHRSYYTDMVTGQKYFSYIADEVPKIARQFFNISKNREDNFIAGLSMGGYGAFKVALKYPERFSAAASLSGVLDIQARLKRENDEVKFCELKNIFGEDLEVGGTENDLLHLCEKLQNVKQKPLLYQCCGTEDFLYNDNVKFNKYAKSIGLPIYYEEGQGDHNWKYWDNQIQRVLEWLPIKV